MANAPTLKGFIAWLQQQQPDETYDQDKPQICPLGQYFRSIDLEPQIMVLDAADVMRTPYMPLLRAINASSSKTGARLNTFGSLLQRLQESA